MCAHVQLGALDHATLVMKEAIHQLRRSRQPGFLAHGLMARAALRRLTTDRERADADLQEAERIVLRRQMRLCEADVRLEHGRRHLAKCKRHGHSADLRSAHDSLLTAEQMIDETGLVSRREALEDLSHELAATL